MGLVGAVVTVSSG